MTIFQQGRHNGDVECRLGCGPISGYRLMTAGANAINN